MTDQQTCATWLTAGGPAEQDETAGVHPEFARMGEIRRSMEQTSLYRSTDSVYTTGFIIGLNRTVARTV